MLFFLYPITEFQIMVLRGRHRVFRIVAWVVIIGCLLINFLLSSQGEESVDRTNNITRSLSRGQTTLPATTRGRNNITGRRTSRGEHPGENIEGRGLSKGQTTLPATTRYYPATSRVVFPIKDTEVAQWCSGLGRTQCVARETPARVFSVILYNGESDMLALLISHVAPHVDALVVVEAVTTLAGAPKKISAMPISPIDVLHVMVTNTSHFSRPDTDARPLSRMHPDERHSFAREFSQRRAGLHSLISHFNANPNDVVIIGDVDELPHANQIRILRYCLPLMSLANKSSSKDANHWMLPMRTYFYNLCCGAGHDVSYAVAGHVSFLMKDLALARMCKWIPGCDVFLVEPEGSVSEGWHLSFFLTPEEVRRKIASYAHTRRNMYPYNTLPWISDRMASCRHLFDRTEAVGMMNLTIAYVPISIVDFLAVRPAFRGTCRLVPAEVSLGAAVDPVQSWNMCQSMTTGAGKWNIRNEFVDFLCERLPLMSSMKSCGVQHRWLFVGDGYLLLLARRLSAALSESNSNDKKHIVSYTTPHDFDPTYITEFNYVVVNFDFMSHLSQNDTSDFMGIMAEYLTRFASANYLIILAPHRSHPHAEGISVSERHCASDKRQFDFRQVLRCVAVRVVPHAVFLDTYSMMDINVHGMEFHFFFPESSQALDATLRILLHGVCRAVKPATIIPAAECAAKEEMWVVEASLCMCSSRCPDKDKELLKYESKHPPKKNPSLRRRRRLPRFVEFN